MKEKRLKDGKRSLRKLMVSTEGEKPAKRADAWRPKKPGSVRLRRQGPKEHRYVIEDNGREHHVFDPETSLHIGKHGGTIGVVYRFRTDVRTYPWGDPHDYDSSSTVRGLVPWDGKGGEKEVRLAAAALAIKTTRITRPPASLIDELCKPGKWGSQEFWRKLVEAHKEASDLGLLKEVMES